MKIDPTSIPALTTSAGSALTGAARPETRNAANSSTQIAEGNSKDQVQISNLLESLRKAGAAADEEISPERAAHLDKLAAAVQSGDYQIDAKELSSRIVEDTLRGIG
jgi:anti-sigma28 factor (negative regulator of flagellin synthesis)